MNAASTKTDSLEQRELLQDSEPVVNDPVVNDPVAHDPVVEVIGEDTTPQSVGTDRDGSEEGDDEEQSAESNRSWLGEGPPATDTVADLLDESPVHATAHNPAGSP